MDEDIKSLTSPVRAVYISTYIPRKCGIATFTKDLTNAINLLNPSQLARFIAMDNSISEELEYPHEVIFRIRQEVDEDYKNVIGFINNNKEIDIVVMQHEFGIYGGPSGRKVLELAEQINKPIVTVFHTVTENPNRKQSDDILNRIAKISKFVVVMLEVSRDILIRDYGVAPRKIVVIPHGVPDFPRLGNEGFKRKFRLGGRTVMSSINLLSESKGIEYAIRGLTEVVKERPDFMYLVIGETHPVVKLYEGEKFRNRLKKLVRDLNLTKNVRFVNRYVPLDELMAYIGASDLYITPYLDPQQSASGALAYAVGAGKACISTPYLYAKEVFAAGCGKLVPFKDGKAIGQAINEFLGDPERKARCEAKAYELGRTMTWHNVAHQYFHLLQHAI